MTKALEVIEQEGETLEDLEQEWQAQQSEASAEENRATKEETEQARALAEKMNSGFLWLVNRTQCPHVRIDEIVDRQAGDDAFEPLAERWGGEVPEWVQQFSPYIGAGIYMATTIVTARQIEAQILEEQKKKEEKDNGEEPEAGETE